MKQQILLSASLMLASAGVFAQVSGIDADAAATASGDLGSETGSSAIEREDALDNKVEPEIEAAGEIDDDAAATSERIEQQSEEAKEQASEKAKTTNVGKPGVNAEYGKDAAGNPDEGSKEAGGALDQAEEEDLSNINDTDERTRGPASADLEDESTEVDASGDADAESEAGNE